MRALLVTTIATALIAVGCATAPASQTHEHISATTSVKLTGPQACEQLLADVTRNHGIPHTRTLRYIADHVTVPRLAADARTAVRDIGHTGTAPVALSLLRDDCARAGVTIPAP